MIISSCGTSGDSQPWYLRHFLVSEHFHFHFQDFNPQTSIWRQQIKTLSRKYPGHVGALLRRLQCFVLFYTHTQIALVHTDMKNMQQMDVNVQHSDLCLGNESPYVVCQVAANRKHRAGQVVCVSEPAVSVRSSSGRDARQADSDRPLLIFPFFF